jgi:site-specific DNA-methyltransferase (adenine-specific)
MRLELGDCLEVLKTIPDNSVDSIVTDPPYALNFMGKKWDYDVPSKEIWEECLRVLKPGAHLLSFGGSRTYHRMVVRIEDAGFQIRDQIMWMYGSGFPKSHNIGKSIDKLQGNEREVVGIQKLQGTAATLKGKPNRENWYDQGEGGTYTSQIELTKGTSEWEGWGTALKPAHEPIVLARKPLSEKTVAENVLKWGTGGLNIDVSRIGTDDDTSRKVSDRKNEINIINSNKVGSMTEDWKMGRWPANIILDEEAGQVLDQQSGISTGKVGMTQQSSPNNIYQGFKSKGDTKVNDGKTDKGGASRFFYCPKTSKKDRNEGMPEEVGIFHQRPRREDGTIIYKEKNPEEWDEAMSKLPRKDKTSKAAAEEKLQDNTDGLKNNHPTVKPTALMEYLIKLITPVGGTVMDCFLGSGSTGKAAVRNGFDFIGIEREEEYLNIARARINNELK